ncbi:hypothetical protein N5J43_30165 [Pseudomonas nicosulfuronedens]|uniref:hypothetical protein n=1 Tax=Pseudomonas nicosulfuronedens TaxID=2571105 RepID=UPI00244D6374|nr:hypothetical protein [Pseudomonas nicosulfuronedens]MDH1011697.1 hypothetical protein [Pseudomonas nicosulfuronedens]MDH1011700.1 hypothetical protein [Pseudomonas nicosulfuronedens]MDH1983238.1 hypothetical protein [Pseudomonas nicosulfuronedens]MDH2027434.1 hypothetical protein [Pseudomonas nicosulfuronedens]MDH2027437.1 hypothetical protein [Pseudomonas nicosulfuronedens]
MNIGDIVDLEGWLVIIGYGLFLIPENFSENYESGERVEISSPEIMFSVMEKILPLAGGKSFIFHRSRVSGVLIDISPAKIKPTALFVEERGGGFLSISLDGDDFGKYKVRYEKFLKERKNIKSDDWLDYL